MSQEHVDVVVIGAGHQGLVAATALVEKGLSVVVVERSDVPGGAIRSGQLTLPGFTHDYWATNMGLFLGSPYFARHGGELAALGLKFAHSSTPYASAFPNGKNLKVVQDGEATAAMWAAHNAGDAKGWAALGALFGDFAGSYFPMYGNPLPSKGTWQGARTLWKTRGKKGSGELLRILLSSTRALGDRYFETPEAKSLLAAWGMHIDYAPDITGGAVFPLLECFLDMANGMSIVEGGASNLVNAMVALLEKKGGKVRLGTDVARILVNDKGAFGVRLANGEQILAKRGVISTVVLPVMVSNLLESSDVPAHMKQAASHYRFGPGTMMVHLATSGPIPWSDSELGKFAYVHVGPYVDDMARTYQQSLAGEIPDEPLLIVGQSSVVDPSRAPEGKGVVWIQVRTLPNTPNGSTWGAESERVADLVIAKMERYAPGFTATILDRHVMSPADLHASNPNLVGGDSVAGSHHFDQFLMRPSLELGKYATEIPRLYRAGAGTWPGAGANAISGGLAAARLLKG